MVVIEMNTWGVRPDGSSTFPVLATIVRVLLFLGGELRY